MKELEALLDRRWILKSQDKELYYQVRDAWARSVVSRRTRWDAR